MPNHASAQKRVRRNARRAEINGARMSRMRTFIKKVEQNIEEKNYDGANAALKAAQPEIMRSVAKGLVHKNTAARKVSRLSARIRALK